MANYAVGGELMMKHRCGRLVPLAMILLGLSACTGVQPAPHASTSPRASASPVAADPQRCDRLAKRGFTPCPPPADRLTLPPTTIRNATGGAVPDATAQKWGRAFQLAQAYYYWAMQNNARAALTSGALADPSPKAVTNLFGTDLKDLDDAKAAGGVLVYEPPNIPIVQVVSVPADLQSAMARQGLTPASYAVAVRLTGPTSRSMRLPNGASRPISSGDAKYIADVLVWGEPRNEPDLGTSWFEYGYYGCDGSVRNVCGL
jgi:hypothetical protein